MSEEREQEAAARSAADVAAMLIELGRAVKACHFYASDHPARKATLERSFRAFESTLARAGALELDVSAGALHVGGGDPIGRGSLDELVRALIERGVRCLRFEPGLEHDAFVQLVAVLTLDPDELGDAGGVKGALAAAGAGVRVNEPGTEEAAVADAVDAEVASASPVPAEPAADDDRDLPAPKVQTTDADPLTRLDGLLHEKATEVEDGTLAPQAAPEPGADLVACLRSLDECRDEARYAELLQRVAVSLDELEGPSAGDEPYRAILVLCSHAMEGSRSERQRLLAEEALFHVAAGPRLADLVLRACADGTAGSVRATQILLHLGAHAVPHLLDALLAADDPERRGRLNAVVIAMGEKTAPVLKEALDVNDPQRARLAARLAGELQNPELITYLRGILREAEAPDELQREVAKALARIGNAAATQVLIESLSHPSADVAAGVAHSMGGVANAKVVEGLVGALRRALRDDELELARESIRALGRVGRAEAVPTLAAILERRSWIGRKRLRELKLAAAAALGRLPGDEAHQILERCAQARGDAQVRRAAQTALASRP